VTPGSALLEARDAVLTFAPVHPWECCLEADQLAHKAIDVLSDRQATDLALIDISKTSGFADYFVVATAGSPLQFKALQEHVDRELSGAGLPLRHAEGTADSGWVLMDFGQVIVHIFTAEKRTFYRLEELWGKTSPVVRFAD
jgi:ribosome-associated protein